MKLVVWLYSSPWNKILFIFFLFLKTAALFSIIFSDIFFFTSPLLTTLTRFLFSSSFFCSRISNGRCAVRIQVAPEAIHPYQCVVAVAAAKVAFVAVDAFFVVEPHYLNIRRFEYFERLPYMKGTLIVRISKEANIHIGQHGAKTFA